MLVSQGDARSLSVDRRLACILAAVAGALNAAAFYSVGFFSANMTGNVSAMSDRLAMGLPGPAFVYLAIVCAFIFGAICSTLMIGAGHHRNFAGIYAGVIFIEAVGLAALGGLQVWLGARLNGAILVLGLACLMGLQNAVVTRISDARVRTTHVSGMATDIGIEIGMLIDAWRHRSKHSDISAVRTRLRLHAETILAFLAGGVVGVLIYRGVGGAVYLIAAAVLGGISLHGMYRARSNPSGAATPPPAPDL